MGNKKNKKTSKNAKKRRGKADNADVWIKKRGFNAFAASYANTSLGTISDNSQKQRMMSTDVNKIVKIQKAISPESGIHSMAWANATIPQPGLLSLPSEIRMRIWDLVARDFGGRSSIAPVKKTNRDRFKCPYWPSAGVDTGNLYGICRQIYIDVVGSGALYKAKKFLFQSPTSMLNYLWVINPAHKTVIQNLSLSLYFGTRTTWSASSVALKAITMLANDCASLQELSLYIEFSDSCDVAKATATVGSCDPLHRVLSRLKSFRAEWNGLVWCEEPSDPNLILEFPFFIREVTREKSPKCYIMSDYDEILYEAVWELEKVLLRHLGRKLKKETLV